MKLKSLMLGAAAVAAATSAQAADLPVAVEPVDYVKVCDAHGARFFYIPGTDTCLRVGGRVRADYVLSNLGKKKTRADDNYAFKAKAYIYLDSRTSTEFGLLRTYTDISVDSSHTAKLNKGYIQWGGFTFGRTNSFFDFYTGSTYMGTTGRNWSDATTQLVAYTAAFGDGFSATLSLEDGKVRRSKLDPRSGLVPVVAGSNVYGGNRMPDVVANLRVDQGWGSAQLSGALHQVYSLNTNGKNRLGWAVGGGVTVNFMEKSNINFQAQYAQGAMSYTGYTALGDFVGRNVTRGYSLSAGIKHQATSDVALALDGSFASQSISNAKANRWAIDGSVKWSPVSGFDIGADLGYSSERFKLNGVKSKTMNAWTFGVRVQRTF